MKNTITYTLLFSLLIFSCNKILDPTPTPQASAPNTTPTFAGSDAVFAAVSSLTYTSTVVGEYAVDVDVAVAALYDGTNAYFPMGTVGVNSNNLDMSDNNTYTSVATTGTPVIDLGFDDSSNNSWVISGSSNLPAFNFTTSRAMPTNIKFSAEVEKVSNLEGIVLIDELETHLHPKWQKEFPRLLSELFPKIQFIVTTHSPLVFLGMPPDKTVVYNVGRDENNQTEATKTTTSGINAESVEKTHNPLASKTDVEKPLPTPPTDAPPVKESDTSNAKITF